MPQLQLPIFPVGTTLINANLGFIRENDRITYVYGNLPVFTHDVNDIRSFRMITSQFYINGGATQSEICRAFGVSSISVKRSVKLYREKGMGGFFETPKRRGAAVLTPEVVQKVQELLDSGEEISSISKELGLKYDTLRKAVKSGKLHKPFLKKN
jgi:transposase-like protein